MALPPQKFREVVFQMLYSRDFHDVEEAEMISFMMQEIESTRKNMAEAMARVQQVLEKKNPIDEEIRAASTEYSFERISQVEKTILRLGLYEILFDSQIPPKVAIAEAIRLCRKFGTPESASFVNAILDGIYKKHAQVAEEPVSL